MTRGTVKWFNDAKCYGFIRADGIEEDIFVHFRAIQMDGYKSLDIGDAVEFDLVPNDGRGLKAENVVRIARPDARSFASSVVETCKHVDGPFACVDCIKRALADNGIAETKTA